MSLADAWSKIKLYEEEIFIVAALILVGAFGFGLGRWSKLTGEHEPLKVENVPAVSVTTNGGEVSAAQAGAQNPPAAGRGNFVASKNGAKYYRPDCAGVKRIKEENKIWFDSAEEARARGYTPAANCPGL